jgi:hypothetical protein
MGKKKIINILTDLSDCKNIKKKKNKKSLITEEIVLGIIVILFIIFFFNDLKKILFHVKDLFYNILHIRSFSQLVNTVMSTYRRIIHINSLFKFIILFILFIFIIK